MRDIRRREYDMWIFVPSALLIGAGLVMVFSASQMQALADYGDMFHYIKRQIVWVALGIGTMLLMMRLNLDNAKKLAPYVYAGALLGLVAVMIIGKTIGGAKRWIDVGLGTLQPSEFAKPALAFFLAWYYDMLEKSESRGFLMSVIVPAGLVGVGAILILIEPDFSTMGLYIVIGLAMVFINTVYKAVFAVVGGPLVLTGLIWALKEDYRRDRILGFLNPWKDPSNKGYQIIQTLYALGSGGLKGLGLGLSRQKMYYIPEQHTDFIFAVVGEELGLIGTGGFAVMYLIIAIRGLRLANLSSDVFRSNLAYGLSIWLAIQAFINMGVVANLLPVTGMTLPLVSAGGSSLIPTMAAIGLLLNVSRSA